MMIKAICNIFITILFFSFPRHQKWDPCGYMFKSRKNTSFSNNISESCYFLVTTNHHKIGKRKKYKIESFQSVPDKVGKVVKKRKVDAWCLENGTFSNRNN